MKFVQKDMGGRIEILANDHYVGKPVTVAFGTGVTLVKAGTPLSAAGGAATDTDVAGVLLWDVTPDNPNGTVVVHGFIETAKAQAHSGVTVTAAMKALLPMVSFV